MSRALKSRQGSFTIQWQRAHIDAADIKSGNHNTAIVFGNEMADAMAKQAALRWLGWMRWRGRSKGESLRQTCKRPKPPHCFDWLRTGSQEGTVQNCPAGACRTNNTPAGISAIKAAAGMSNLQESMGETSLVRWFRAGPCSGEIQTMQSIRNSLGLGVKHTKQLGGKLCIPRIQLPNIEVLRGAGIVRHGLLELCAD